MIFQTITSLTYAVLHNTTSLSLPQKQHGPTPRQWSWVSWLGSDSTATKASFPKSAQSPSVHGFPMTLPAAEPYLPWSQNRLFGGCVNSSDLWWPKLSLAATGNPQKIQPVYFMTWSRPWPENPTKWEA